MSANKTPKYRSCKICEDHLSIENFNKCNSKISPESRKHTCIDCEKEIRKEKNKQYYNNKKSSKYEKTR